MAKQAIKKGTGIKKKGINELKNKLGLNVEATSKVLSVSNADKPLDWYIMPKAFQESTKLPGICKGIVTSVIGHSNVGKSTLVNHAIIAAQRQGDIPVIIDTENAFSFQYAKSMGFECEPVYGEVEIEEVDPETGEITTHTETQIVHWDGDFIYYNNKLLCERFGKFDYSQGKETQKKRTVAVVEDVAMCINELLDAQDNGDIEQGFLFVWDSVGSIGSFKEYNAKGVGNAMWTAASISQAFNTIVNDRIPSSRKQSSPYTNSFLYINKVWMDSMTNQMGPAIMQTKGGKSLKYATRMEILMGGQLTSGIKRLTATYRGLTYSYGIETKIKVLKNHLDAPHNVCYEGKMIATDVGFVSPDDLDAFKKSHITDILKQLEALSKERVTINAEDIDFIEEEEEQVQ